MLMRVGLFVVTNLAVLFVLNLVLTLTGLNQPGQSWLPLLIMAGIFGMAGSFISLLMSKRMAKRATGAHVIIRPTNQTEQWLQQTVFAQAEAAGIGQPEVAIFNSSAPNAFATGANKNDALVAVSTGLLEHMNRDEVEAVLAHEVSHVANGDMVTLSLIQGVLNTFVIVIAQVVSSLIDGRRSGGGGGVGFGITYMLAQTVLGFLATLIVRWFSRWREFRADAGGAKLAGSNNMIAALRRLQQSQQASRLPRGMDALGIQGGLFSASFVKRLLMTHPPLEDRIAALSQRAEIATNRSQLS